MEYLLGSAVREQNGGVLVRLADERAGSIEDAADKGFNRMKLIPMISMLATSISRHAAMLRRKKIAVAALILAVSFVGPAAAGPYEDGVVAQRAR
jgi:hypothetical protein